MLYICLIEVRWEVSRRMFKLKKKNIQNTRFGIQSDNEKLCNNLLNMCVHIFQIIFW